MGLQEPKLHLKLNLDYGIINRFSKTVKNNLSRIKYLNYIRFRGLIDFGGVIVGIGALIYIISKFGVCMTKLTD